MLNAPSTSSIAIDTSAYARADACCDDAGTMLPHAAAGSRRRRLWQLDASTHCPVLGVCVPIAVLRRIVMRDVANCADDDDDYRVHCLAVNACKQRCAPAEALHKELERRYAAELRQVAAVKSVAELSGAWREARDGQRMPGVLWAVLTHPRCDAQLEQQMLADVHMLQHQRGALQRVDQARFDAVQKENAALRQQIEALLSCKHKLSVELAQHAQRAQAQAMQSRAQAIGHDTALAALRDELHELQASAPRLKPRAELARHAQLLGARVAAVEGELLDAQQRAARDRQRAQQALSALPHGEAQSPAPPPAPALDDRAVLCVGGRAASVPLYRHIVEGRGARFLHHDGGAEQSAQQLDATLSAADLVICQTGCISHGAYWRVKDHCKRHGKRCVFVDKPGSAALKRALAQLQA